MRRDPHPRAIKLAAARWTAYAAVIDTRAWAAARNNAEWCDLVCRGHGVTTQLDARLWVARHHSPPYDPDAVTLLPDVTVDEVLSQIDVGDGCSVKDSFAALDLRPAGFRVLFEAEWIQTEDGRTRIECRFEGETIWLTQALMAELFQTTLQNINLHLQNIYEEGEPDPEAT